MNETGLPVGAVRKIVLSYLLSFIATIFTTKGMLLFGNMTMKRWLLCAEIVILLFILIYKNWPALLHLK